jgi:DNA ligase (NAD+)
MYYQGNPVLSDAEFDKLADQHNYNSVGYRVESGVSHYFPMYSQQKFFSVEECPASSNDSGYVGSVKLDGAAVSLLYINGKLQQALTRGDGKNTGEVVAPKDLPNARNLAAGSLNLKDIEEFRKRPLQFIAYDAQSFIADKWTEAMAILASWGFNTVLTTDISMYPDDGEVYRIDDYYKFEKLGYTAHHPRGAFALKEQKEGVVTKLLDVKWQVGKSGVVSPVAILEPIIIGEATVSRATLHNIEYIRELDLEIGCDVEVIRSGEIIPRILRRVQSS